MHVVIPEMIPSLNKGEMAIFEGIRRALMVFGSPKITLYCAWLETDRERYDKEINTVGGIDLYDLAATFSPNPPKFSWRRYFSRWSKLIISAIFGRISLPLAKKLVKDPLLREFITADLIIVGHDGCLNVELFWFVLAAKILHIPIAIFGVGTVSNSGRLKGFYYREMLKYAFKHTIFNSVRDTCSTEFLLANDVSQEYFHLFPDPAILMKPAPKQSVDKLLFKENIPNSENIPLFGIIPVKGGIVFWKSFSAEKDKQKKNEKRVNLWTELIIFLINNTNAHFVFIPHCIGPTPGNDDRTTAKEIAEKLSAFKNRFTLITNEYSPQELKGLMGQCNFILGERTHALLGALSLPIPCMALSTEEDKRMHYIVKEMFQRPVYNLNAPDIADLQQAVLREWDNRANIKIEMQPRTAEAITLAEKAARILKERYDQYLTR
jgi:polysaccharide pyruvyl transferase WcaK-like protein